MTFHFNTAIAEVMTLFIYVRALGEIEKVEGEDKKAIYEAVRTMLLLIAPIVPHIAEELWEKLNSRG